MKAINAHKDIHINSAYNFIDHFSESCGPQQFYGLSQDTPPQRILYLDSLYSKDKSICLLEEYSRTTEVIICMVVMWREQIGPGRGATDAPVDTGTTGPCLLLG